MNTPLRQIDHDALDAYIDGRLAAGERAAFEARLAREPALQSELERQRVIDAALGRLFASPAPPELERIRGHAEPIKLAPRLLRLPWRPLATAAAIVLIVGGGWWQWQRMTQPSAGPMPKQTIFASYQAKVADNLKVAGKCWDDKQFAMVFFGQLAVAVTVTPPPAGVELLGIDYSNTLSYQTTMLVARVNGHPVIAYVDRKERDRGPTTAPSGCAELRTFRRELDELVIYEISGLDRPHLLDLFKKIEMQQDWLDELKRTGKPY